MSIVKQRQEILDSLLCFEKSDNRDSQENKDSQERVPECQEMANSEEDRYYNAVVKKQDNTEKSEKTRHFSLRGNLPFKFHGEDKLSPPLPPSRTSTSRFQPPHHPVTHSSPRVTRTLPRRQQEEYDSFESNTMEAG